MRNRRAGALWVGLISAAVTLGTVGVLGPPAHGQAAKKTAKGRATKGNGPVRKAPNAADPLVAPKDQAVKGVAGSTYHFRLRLQAFDDTPLVASYYPAKLETTSPVVLLVHDKGRSAKDFEDPIAELKNKGFAEHLQGLGYAVLSFDLRGHGANTRRAVPDSEWAEMVDDLQTAYQFLVDRHNRGELNLARLGVVALGEGANLSAAWAYQPGGAVSHEGRVTDLAALVLISPLPSGEGFSFSTLMNSLAPRIPVLLMAGEKDAPSHDILKRVRVNVERTRQNKVELFPSSLHGYKLLRLEPKATTAVTKFLDTTIKFKSSEWEPRYNLSPVRYSDIQFVRHVEPLKPKDVDAPKAQEKPAEKEKAGAKDADKAEAKDADKAEEK